MGGIGGGLIDSVTEGVEALGGSVKHAIEGDWEEAGKDFARVGLEAAGIVGQQFLGPGAEIAQETIEGALDNAVLERGTGDVPGPKGKGADWSVGNLLSGAADGAFSSVSNQYMGGQGTMGKLLGAAGGGGGAGGAGGLQDLFSSFLSSGEAQQFSGQLGDFSDAVNMMNSLDSSAGDVSNRMLSASV